MKKIVLNFLLVHLLCPSALCTQPHKVLASADSKQEIYYVVTEEEIAKHASRRDDFGKISLTIPQFVKKAEKHINEVQIKKIAPSVSWPPSNYNGGGEYPVNRRSLNFYKMEVVEFGFHVYLKFHFLVYGPVSSGPSLSTCVVFYLDGEIAKFSTDKSTDK